MKKTLLLLSAVLVSGCLLAQTRPAVKQSPKTPSSATTKTPEAGPAQTSADPDKPAPALDADGWPVADPNAPAPAAKGAKAKTGAKKAPARGAKGGKAAAPAKPKVYQPAAFYYSIDAKPVDAKIGLPSKGKGLLSVDVRNHLKVERENPKSPIKVELTLVERATNTPGETKEITITAAKKGIDVADFFGKVLKPGDEIQIALTNVKQPQTTSVTVEIPESSIFALTHEGKKLDKKKGLAAGSTGVLSITPKNAEKLKTIDSGEAIGIEISHIRNGSELNKIDAQLADAESGLLLEGILQDAKAGDKIKVELTNTQEPHEIYIPLQ